VPIYNTENYLRQCLDSICAQSFTDFEVICINDGSTDGSLNIIIEFMRKDHRFTCIDKRNSGYGASMNKGIVKATGKYLAIVESDDFIDPDTFSTLISAAQEHDAEVVKSNAWLHWSKPEAKDELIRLVPQNSYNRPLAPLNCHEIFFLKPSIWSAIYRRDFIFNKEDMLFLQTPGASYQDAGFNFKVWASAKRVVFLNKAFVHYRQDNEASSVNSPAKAFCVCDEYAEMRRFLDKHILKTDVEKYQQLWPILIRMCCDSYMWNYDRLCPDLGLDFLRRWSTEFGALKADGKLDMKYVGHQRQADVLHIISDPVGYHSYKLALTNVSGSRAKRQLKQLGHYIKLGGLKLALRVVIESISSNKSLDASENVKANETNGREA
jgi:glycosyltransferase involved in cell wall biosynthesis